MISDAVVVECRVCGSSIRRAQNQCNPDVDSNTYWKTCQSMCRSMSFIVSPNANKCQNTEYIDAECVPAFLSERMSEIVRNFRGHLQVYVERNVWIIIYYVVCQNTSNYQNERHTATTSTFRTTTLPTDVSECNDEHVYLCLFHLVEWPQLESFRLTRHGCAATILLCSWHLLTL